MGLIPDGDKQELKKLLEERMKDEVEILFFKGNTPQCQYCNQIEMLLEEVSSLSSKIVYKAYNHQSDLAKRYDVKTAPVITFKQKPNIRFLGAPSGYEFSVFLEDIIRISRNEVDLKLNTVQKISKIKKPVYIMVFVTPTCPYCPAVVKTAHMFAFINSNITSEMVEALEYRELAKKWNVMAVPKVVINEKIEFEGAYPEEIFADKVLEVL